MARKPPQPGSMAHERREMKLIDELADMHRDLKKAHGHLSKVHGRLSKAAQRGRRK